VQSVFLGSVLLVFLVSSVSYAADDGKWQEAEVYVDNTARICSEQDTKERVMGCAQNVCKQAHQLATQTLGMRSHTAARV
jgi:hypothetical protein